MMSSKYPNPKIRFASIITTYRCNAKCVMCDVWKYPTRRSEEIQPEELKSLPDDMEMVNVTGGEPFLREDLEAIITTLKPKSRRVVISTNGYFVDRILKLAKKHPWIGIRISTEGLPKANDEIRGMADGFDHSIRALAELRNMGVKDIGFGITISDRNIKDLMELYHLSKMMGMEFATAAVHNSFYFHKMNNGLANPQAAIDELQKLIKELLESNHIKDWFRAYFNHGLINYIKGQPRLLPCEMGHDSFFLDPYGEVFPCNVMEESMGNFREQSFEDVWYSERAEEVRDKVRKCPRNCWMVGSVSQQMKKYIAKPASWVLDKKLRGYNEEETMPVDLPHPVLNEAPKPWTVNELFYQKVQEMKANGGKRVEVNVHRELNVQKEKIKT